VQPEGLSQLKNPTDSIGNRNRDLPICIAVPQPNVHRVPIKNTKNNFLDKAVLSYRADENVIKIRSVQVHLG
jgi:hypothetical protein